MRWFFSAPKSLNLRRARGSRRAARRSRSWFLEDLEGRRLPSAAIQPFVTLPPASSNIVSGPGGDLWVGITASVDLAAIERIGLDGSVTTFPVPSNGDGMSIDDLTTGPDGNVWFIAYLDNVNVFAPSQAMVGYVTPAGVITEFPPSPGASSSSIVSGPDGDLWFDYTVNFRAPWQNFIAQITTSGVVTTFPVPSFGARSASVRSLAVGSDGNLRFTDYLGKNHFVLGRMSPSGVVTQVPVPGHLEYADVANGPDGSLILDGVNRKGRNEVFTVTTAGAFTQDKIPAKISNAFGTYLGAADGSLWFAGNGSLKTLVLGEINASGVATSYNVSRFVSGRQKIVTSMAIGQDGNLYLLVNDLTPLNPTTTVYRLSPSELT